MASALVTLLLLSWVGLTATAGVALAADHGWAAASLHVHLAIPAFLFGTLAHALSMFYFIGTGRVIKDAVADNGFDPAWAEETRQFKQRTFPWATWALILIMATSILGGAADTAHIPLWVHTLAALLMLSVTLRAVVVTISCISKNLQLMDRLERALAEQPASGEA